MKDDGITDGAATARPETLAQTIREAAQVPGFSGLAIGILAASILLRAVLISHASWVPVSDSRDYHAFANSLLKGRGYQQTYRGETDAFNGFTFYAFRPPGYPALIAGLHLLFGRDPRVLLIANIPSAEATARSSSNAYTRLSTPSISSSIPWPQWEPFWPCANASACRECGLSSALTFSYTRWCRKATYGSRPRSTPPCVSSPRSRWVLARKRSDP